MTLVYIVVGAMAGAPLRYWLGTRVQEIGPAGFPLGTFAVNLIGCTLIGFLLAIAESRDFLSREMRLLLITGFLGSFTTFSAFGYETYALLRASDYTQATANVLLSVVGCLAGVWIGSIAGRAV
jgi:fluoride exporter